MRLLNYPTAKGRPLAVVLQLPTLDLPLPVCRETVQKDENTLL